MTFLLLASLGASSPPPSSRAVVGALACFLALRRSWTAKGGGIDGVGGGGPAHLRQWLGTLTLAQLTGLAPGVPAPPRAVGCALRRHRSRARAVPRLHVDPCRRSALLANTLAATGATLRGASCVAAGAGAGAARGATALAALRWRCGPLALSDCSKSCSFAFRGAGSCISSVKRLASSLPFRAARTQFEIELWP